MMPSQRLFQLFLLAISAWAVIYMRFALGPLQEAMRLELGLNDNQVALLLGPAVAVPLALGAIPAGLIVDRYSRAPLCAIFIAIGFGAMVLTAVTNNMLLLVVGRVLVGVTVVTILVVAFSIVSDLYEPAQRGRATMVLLIGEIGGSPAAFALGGTLLVMGESTSSFGFDGWRWALLWMSAPVLICALLMLALREPPRTGVIVKNPPLRELWPELWRYRGVAITLLFARIMAWVGDGAVMVWGAPTFERNFGLSPQQTGAVMATALLVSGVVGPLLGGPLADFCQRHGGSRRTVAVLSFAMLLSVPAALYGIMPNPTLAGIALTVFLTVGFMIAAAGMAIATVIIPGELRGLFISITFALSSLFSFALAPVLVSSLSGVLGGPSMIGQSQAVIGGVTAVVGAIIFGYGRRYFPGAEQEAGKPGSFVAERARPHRVDVREYQE
jgi:MFS family permease